MKEYFALYERTPGFYASRSEMVFDALRKIKPEAEWNKFIWPLPNCWLGVSVENQKAADSRIPLLLMTPVKIKFLSCEPLLEAINLNKYVKTANNGDELTWLDYLHLIIIGGESGNGARPCQIDWIRSLIEQCKPTNVSVFVKQLGSVSITDTDTKIKLKDRKGGNIDEFPEDLRIREFPCN